MWKREDVLTRFSYFLYSDALTPGALSTHPGEAASPKAGQFLEIVNSSLVSMLFKHKSPIQSPHLHHLLYGGSHTLGYCPLALITPATYRTTRDSLFVPEPNPKPAHPVSPVSPHRNHNESSCPLPPPLLLPPR